MNRGAKALLHCWIRARIAVDRFGCYLCGSIAQVVQLGEGLSGGILWGLGSSVIIIAVLCGILFRSLKFTLLALPPNLFPVLALYGVMGLFKIPISSGSAMVATIASASRSTTPCIRVALPATNPRARPGHPARHRADHRRPGPADRPDLGRAYRRLYGLLVDRLSAAVSFRPAIEPAMTAAMLGDLFMLPNLLMLLISGRKRAETSAPKPTSATRKSRRRR